ncbi:hypothetical protein ACHAQA_005162 [Verticillium albo-atrum]
MQLTTITSAILAATPAAVWAADWKFTAPDPSSKLDLSRNITIEWEYTGSGNQTKYKSMHLLFSGESTDLKEEPFSFASQQVIDIDPNAGSYVLNGTDTYLYRVMNGEEDDIYGNDPTLLPSDIRVSFTAALFEDVGEAPFDYNGTLNFTSDEYEVEGFPREPQEDSAAGSVFVSAGPAMAIAAAIVAWL